MEEDYESDGQIESKDFLDIFMDNSADQLTDSFLASKKKLATLNSGRNLEFDKLRLKGKALEMINMILVNNKDVLRSDDVYMNDELKSVFVRSKNDKSIFESNSKR